MELAMVAAGFTPGEADRLRRSMAAWKRSGGLEPFEQRLKSGMRRNGYSAQFAEAIYRQILGFGEYGFPESHSASFALLVYVSSWIKCHHPAAFCAALLNSQPMGFYAPAQLVQDARRHGVEVRPPDVQVERLGLHAGRRRAAAGPAHGERPVREGGPAHRRRAAPRGRAGAQAQPQGSARARRGGCPGIAGRSPPPGATGRLPAPRAARRSMRRRRTHPPVLARPRESEEIVADYASLGLTLGRHPVALLRQSAWTDDAARRPRT